MGDTYVTVSSNENYQVNVNVKLQNPDGSWNYPPQGALVLFYISATRDPNGPIITNPAQYLSPGCSLTNSAGDAYTSFRSSVPGRYQISAEVKCADNIPTRIIGGQKIITVTSPITIPVPSFTATPSSGQAPLKVLFEGSALDPEGIRYHVWNFGDGSGTYSGEGDVSSTWHTYQNAGTFTASLTVTDGQSQQGSTTRQITVTPKNTAPVASFTASPSSGRAPLTVLFDASSSSDADGISSWSWNFGDGTSGQAMTIPHQYQNAGTYTAILTVTDRGSPALTSSTTRQITVTGTVTITPDVNMPPVAMFSTGRTSGNSLTVQFDGSGSTDDGTITSYTWTYGDGATGTGQKVTHKYASDGQYPVTLTVKDNKGLTGTVTLKITVGDMGPTPGGDSKPQVKLTFRASTDAGATANSITGDASTSTDPDGILIYYWNWGDGTKVDSGASPVMSHTYASAGPYTVSVSAIDSKGESATASQQVKVPLEGPVPTPPIEPIVPILALIAIVVILIRRR